MTAPADLLKISDLARRTGVSVGTIRFYVREGLLPQPTLKTSRNMAYYDASFVARIRLIRRLQEERRLPLSMIRTIVASEDGGTVPSVVELEAKAATAIGGDAQEPSITQRVLLERSGIDAHDLEGLCHLEVVRPQGPARAPTYAPVDVALVEVVARLRSLGLPPDTFPISDLELYVRSVRALVAEEVALFARRTRGRALPLPPEQLLDAVVELMGDMVRLLRKKMIVQLLGGERPSRRPRRRRAAR